MIFILKLLFARTMFYSLISSSYLLVTIKKPHFTIMAAVIIH